MPRKLRMRRIRKRVFVFTSLASLASFSSFAHSASWEDEKSIWEEAARGDSYKDPGYAARLAASFYPIDYGHLYVGEIRKGIWTSVGEVLFLGVFVTGFLDSWIRSQRNQTGLEFSADNKLYMAVGAVGYIGLKAWSAFDAAEDAREFNRLRDKKLSEKGSLHFRFSSDTALISYDLSFSQNPF